MFSRYRLLLPLLLLIFIDEMGNGLFYPILAPAIFDPLTSIYQYPVSTAMREFQYELTLAVFPLMMFLSAPLLGDLSDHYGRKRVLLMSLLGTVVGYFISATALMIHNFPLLLLGRAIDGITAGNFPIAQAAIIDVSHKDEKTQNISLAVLAISFGFILGPLFAAVLSNSNWNSHFTLATPLFAAGILSLVNMLMIVLMYNESHPTKDTHFKIQINQAFALLKDAFASTEIRHLSIILFLLLLGWGTYIQYCNIYLIRAFAFTKNQIAGFTVVMALSFALTSLVIIKIVEKRFSNKAITNGALLLSSIGVAITLMGNSPILAWVGLVPTSIGIALAHTTTMALYSDAVSEDRQGWIMGVTTAVVSVAIVASAILDGFLGEVHLMLPIWLAFLFYSLGFVLSTFVYRK